jgi:hypothetical protein
MKVLIINDETIESYLGGAALVNDTIKSQLEEKGHKVDYLIINKETKQVKNNWNKYDYYILANIGYVPDSILNTIINEKRYCKFFHDIPTILYTQPPSVLYQHFYHLWQKMIDNAEKNYFISPMQKTVFERIFKLKNVQLIIPPLDVKSFKNDPLMEPEGCLYVGDISHARGCYKTLQLMKNKFPKTRYHFVGKILDKQLAELLETNGATVQDAISHKDMPNVMNQYKYLFYYPEIYDSFCLKILEASLCGMSILADTYRIGLFSWEMSPQELAEEMDKFSFDIEEK